jgi:CBS domain-containing protein
MTKAAESIGHLMIRDVATLEPSRSVADAVEQMVARDIGCVVVAENGRAIGIFTERDVVRHLARGRDLLERPLSDVMSSPVFTTTPRTDVYEAFETMSEHGFRRLPVAEHGLIVGIVTENDLLRWVRDIAND